MTLFPWGAVDTLYTHLFAWLPLGHQLFQLLLPPLSHPSDPWTFYTHESSLGLSDILHTFLLSPAALQGPLAPQRIESIMSRSNHRCSMSFNLSCEPQYPSRQTHHQAAPWCPPPLVTKVSVMPRCITPRTVRHPSAPPALPALETTPI